MTAARLRSLAMTAVLTLLLINAAMLAARLTWHILGETGIPTDTAAPVQRSAAPPLDLEPILALAPFGKAPRPKAEARETTLGLTLHGVMLARPASASVAYISGADKKVRTYGPDDTLAGGAVLEEVLANKVVLSVQGRRETLSFPKASPKPGVPGLPAGAPTKPTPAADAVIDDYRRRIAANPQTVLDGLGLIATPAGYRIGDAPAAGVRRAGLQPGDVVAKVNGQAVGDIENDRRLFETIAASGRARVEVLRGDSRIVLSFPLQ